MSRSKRKHERTSAITRAREKIARLDAENAHFYRSIANGIPLEEQRVLWCRIQDNKEEMGKLKKKIAQLGRKRLALDQAPIFRDELKGGGAYGE